MISIHVNEQAIEAELGETILSALERRGIGVPTLCHLPKLRPSGACRLCVVELEGTASLVPACSYPVADGMRLRTHSPRVLEARRTIVELLLANHPDDCLYCVRGGRCELQQLAGAVGVRERRAQGARRVEGIDVSSAAIERDPSKCVLCGKCVRICEEVQGISAIDFTGRGAATVVAPAFGRGLGMSSCVSCGQCVMACPTGALTERSSLDAVLRALGDPTLTVVAQHAPAVSVTLGAELGLPLDEDVDGRLVAALRLVGFARVFDTSFAADLTIMEEASELAARLDGRGGPLPMFTSCSPAWVSFVEREAPELVPNLSTCKSPQQMLGALVKTVFAAQAGLDPARIVCVSIMPCTAKKAECGRPEHGRDYRPDVDYVLTTRELLTLLRRTGIDWAALTPQRADLPFGERSSAGKLFGASGGVMEAALRTAHFLMTGEELPEPRIEPLRATEPLKIVRARVGSREIGAAVVSGLGHARRLLEQLRAGRSDLDFIEVMSCEGGCVAGGGQPYETTPETVRARRACLHEVDDRSQLRQSHHNPEVATLYQQVLGAPLSARSHELLHTHYTAEPGPGPAANGGATS